MTGRDEEMEGKRQEITKKSQLLVYLVTFFMPRALNKDKEMFECQTIISRVQNELWKKKIINSLETPSRYMLKRID